jgi:hypothetical protein
MPEYRLGLAHALVSAHRGSSCSVRNFPVATLSGGTPAIIRATDRRRGRELEVLAGSDASELGRDREGVGERGP